MQYFKRKISQKIVMSAQKIRFLIPFHELAETVSRYPIKIENFIRAHFEAF